MIGRLLKMGAYAKSPRMAFGLFHPLKAAKIGAAIWVWRKLFGSKRKERANRPAPTRQV